MPLVRSTYPRGALRREPKAQLAESLTEIVLDVEVDALTDAGRMATAVHFDEVAADAWAMGGVLRGAALAGPPAAR